MTTSRPQRALPGRSRRPQPPTDPVVQALVRAHLARHAVPREVRVVDRLPRSATGKVLHRELRGGGS